MISNPVSSSSWLTIQADDIQATLELTESKWKQVFSGKPFKVDFLDDLTMVELRSSMSTMYLLFLLSGITIIIACLGVYGLVSFAAEQRTREIGIRKVLGASITSMVSLLAREFLILIAISNLIALPLVMMLMHGFLSEFNTRIQIGAGTFLISGMAAALLAALAAGWQAFKAARLTPVESMRHL